jgi:replicative DNA helicase
MKTGFSEPEIEQAFLSCLMQSPDKVFPIVRDKMIVPDHFLDPRCRILFSCLTNWIENAKPVDLRAVTHELEVNDLIKSAGGTGFVTETWIETCHASEETVSYYVQLLEESRARRQLAATIGDLTKESVSPLADAESLINEVRGALDKIELPNKRFVHRSFSEAIDEKMERMEKGEPQDDFIPTGLIDLDEKSPLRRGDMPLIVGARKSGKSILALTVTLNAAKAGHGVLYFSLEDREPKIIDRLFANVSKIPIAQQHMKFSGTVNTSVQAISKLRALPIHIKDDVFDLSSITAITREFKIRQNIGLVIVDYGQLVRVPDIKGRNREQQVAEVSRTLRLLAMELDTPIIVISQLNSEGQTRESRALEQDATACWEIKPGDDEEEAQHIRYISIPWQRNGQSGIAFKVTFLGATSRVETYARHLPR